MRTATSRMFMCFSSKYRELQKTLFLLIHRYSEGEKEEQYGRIWIISQRGLILQCISHTKDRNIGEDIVGSLMKHYSKMERVVMLCQRDSDVDLDLFDFFKKKMEGVSLLMAFYRGTGDLRFLREGEEVKTRE